MEAVSGFKDPDDPEEPPEELGVDVPEDTEAADLAVASSSIAFLRLVTVHFEPVPLVEAASSPTDIAEEGL